MHMLFGWFERICGKIKNFIFPDDAAHVQAAMEKVSKKIFASQQAQEWLKNSGWSACEDVVSALRNPATRDAAVYDAINSFYQSGNHAEKVLARLNEHGLNDGRATHAIVLNSGRGSVGRGKSDHQALLLIDEGVSPPRITLAFRGMNPFSETIDVGMGLTQAALGKSAGVFQHEADLFWKSAGPEITRAIADVRARTGSTPEITVAGHSYGADAAARMLPKLADIVPKSSLHYIGYGGIQSFTRKECDAIQAICADAVQYMATSDPVRGLGFGYSFGEKRNIPSNAGHCDYRPTGNVASLMDAVRDALWRDPKHAEAMANKIVADFRHDRNGTMAQLAAMATRGETSAKPAIT